MKRFYLFFIEDIFQTKIELKKSSFFAFLSPVKEFESLHIRLKKEHPKSNHIVWAYRVLNEYKQIVENSSDDGEPKGTSGPPVLNVMRGENLINCAILVVRYFGGIKLGTGGLVRAYGASAKEVIKEAKLIEYEEKVMLKFHTPFSLLSRFEHYFSNTNIQEIKKDFDTKGALWEVLLTQEQKKDFENFSSAFKMDGIVFL